jgi:hypothetical protein
LQGQFEVAHFSDDEGMSLETPPFAGDLALAITKRH